MLSSPSESGTALQSSLLPRIFKYDEYHKTPFPWLLGRRPPISLQKYLTIHSQRVIECIYPIPKTFSRFSTINHNANPSHFCTNVRIALIVTAQSSQTATSVAISLEIESASQSAIKYKGRLWSMLFSPYDNTPSSPDLEKRLQHIFWLLHP